MKDSEKVLAKERKMELQKVGFQRTAFMPWLITLIIITVSLCAGMVFSLFFVDNHQDKWVQAFLAGGAFAVGLQQWKLARAETSFEKFYERLNLANSRLNDWKSARKLIGHLWNDESEEEYQLTMYVFIELDNLEYCLEKYKRGFMDWLDAYRGMQTFKSRCFSSEFRTLAIEKGHLARYKNETMLVVNNICKNAERSTAAITIPS